MSEQHGFFDETVEQGADSEWNPRPFVVLLEDRDDPGPRLRYRVAAAIGPRDAMSQAQYDRPDMIAVHAEEAA